MLNATSASRFFLVTLAISAPVLAEDGTKDHEASTEESLQETPVVDDEATRLRRHWARRWTEQMMEV